MKMLILKSLLLPACAGAGVIALAWLLPPLRKWKWLGAWAFGLALAVAVLGSWISENGPPTFPIGSRDQWVGVMAVLAAVYAALAALTGKREFPIPQITAVIAGGIVAIAPVIDGMCGGKGRMFFADMGVADQFAIGLAIAFGYLALLGVAERRTGVTFPFSFAIVFAALAILADATGWISMTFACASVALTAFVAGFVALFGGSPSIGRGGLIGSLVLLAIMAPAMYRSSFHDVPWWVFFLLAGSPLVLLPLEFKAMDKMPPWGAAIIRVGCVGILVGIGLIFVVTEAGEDAQDDPMSIYQ